MNDSIRGTSPARLAAAIAATLLACPLAHAQSGAYPTKPVRFLVANAAGGGLDVVARLTSPTVGNALGSSSSSTIARARPAASPPS